MSSKENKRTLPEDGRDECASTETRAKKRRGSMGRFPLSLLVKFWVLKNYEYCPGGGYISSANIVSHIKSDEDMLQENGGKPLSNSQIHLKPIIHKLWKGKVMRTNHTFERNGRRERSYTNLVRRRDLNSEAQSKQAAEEHLIIVPGWQVVINHEKSLSILRVEDWMLDGQRVVTEIRADQGEDNAQYRCTISSHGRKFDPGYMGLKMGQLSSPKEELELLAKCISDMQLCKGFNLPDLCFSSCSFFKVAEYSDACDTNVTENRFFSSSCHILGTHKLCFECITCRKSLLQKKQRERLRLDKVKMTTNHRFMTREQIVSKLKDLRKELIHYKMKVKQLENREDEEEENDSDDNDMDGDDDNNDGGDSDDDNDGDDDDDDDNSADDDADDNDGQ